MNKWKFAFFMVLLLLIVQSIAFFYLYKIGSDMIKQEDKCAASCEQRDADSFYYDDYLETCTCYKDGKTMPWRNVLP